ncbi:MAG: hypothetical protein RLZZ387_5080 [Chloroflexota bacterium]|jgi:anti-sigma B factor antagonist
MAIDVTRTDDGDRSILRIAGALDVNDTPKLSQSIDKLLQERRTHVVVDLSGLNQIDSSGVGALVLLHRSVRASGGQVQIINARDQPLALFKQLRMDKFFSL